MRDQLRGSLPSPLQRQILTIVKVAFNAGYPEAGGVWLLVQSLLTDVIHQPVTPSRSPKSQMPALPHSSSAPAGVPSASKSPNLLLPARSSSSEAQTQRSHVLFTTSSDGKHRSEIIDTPSGHLSQSRLSTGPSPATVRSFSTGRSPSLDFSIKDRRQSVSVAIVNRPRRVSLRRASMNVPIFQNKIDAMSPSSSVRRIAQVGEGALDDSESDSEGSVPETSSGQARSQASALSTTLRGSPSGESLSPLRFPDRGSLGPLSRDDDNDWAEDEGDEDSVSPQSSESELDGSDASTTAARSFRRYKQPNTRSRSSTIAALAADDVPPSGSISRHDSQNSIQTVTVGGKQLSYEALSRSRVDMTSLPSESVVERASVSVSLKAQKRRSQAFSINSVHHSVAEKDKGNGAFDESELRYLENNHIFIKETEKQFREISWNALREVVEEFAQKVCPAYDTNCNPIQYVTYNIPG